MPVRTYSQSDLVLVDTNITGSTPGVDIFNGNVSGIATDGNPSENEYTAYAYLNTSIFPTIPDTALISKVRVVHNVILDVASNIDTFLTTVSVVIRLTDMISGILGQAGGTATVTVHPGTDSFNNQIEFEINYANITKAQFEAIYSSVGAYPTTGTYLFFFIGGQASEDSGSLGSSTYSASASSWRLEVTYDLENYSWYIKPTEVIVNGGKVNTIQNATTDILPIEDGEVIPEGYVLYGTGEDFPDGPEYVWWEPSTDEFYWFFIFSPISPGEGWVALPGSPTCPNCITLTLGALEVLLADASGIYTITSGKRNDSLYVRSGFSTFVGTEEVKIPNPIIKTGFVP